MNDYILLCISIFAYLVGNTIKKTYTTATHKNNLSLIRYNLITAFVAFIFFLCFGFKSVSLFTVLLAVAFSIAILMSTFLGLKAFELGPMSLSTVIISFSTVISALSGAIFYNEVITFSHIIGIILMLLCFVFTVSKDKNKKSSSIKWLIVCIFASLSSGIIGILQKIHQSSLYKGEINEFLMLSFLISTVISLIILLVSYKNNTINSSTKENKKQFIFLTGICLISGVAIAINHKLNLYLSGVFDSATFFPIVNGSGLILSTICAIVLFKEKLTKKQWCGLLLGIIAVIFLCNPF